MINSGVISTNAITFIAQKTSLIARSPGRGSLRREKGKPVTRRRESSEPVSSAQCSKASQSWSPLISQPGLVQPKTLQVGLLGLCQLRL